MQIYTSLWSIIPNGPCSYHMKNWNKHTIFLTRSCFYSHFHSLFQFSNVHRLNILHQSSGEWYKQEILTSYLTYQFPQEPSQCSDVVLPSNKKLLKHCRQNLEEEKERKSHIINIKQVFFNIVLTVAALSGCSWIAIVSSWMLVGDLVLCPSSLVTNRLTIVSRLLGWLVINSLTKKKQTKI